MAELSEWLVKLRVKLSLFRTNLKLAWKNCFGFLDEHKIFFRVRSFFHSNTLEFCDQIERKINVILVRVSIKNILVE